MKWISVKDRLPEYRDGWSHSLDVNVLIDNDGDIFVSTACYRYLNKPEWSEYLYNNRFNGCITHWMPLPEPPKQD